MCIRVNDDPMGENIRVNGKKSTVGQPSLERQIEQVEADTRKALAEASAAAQEFVGDA